MSVKLQSVFAHDYTANKSFRNPQNLVTKMENMDGFPSVTSIAAKHTLLLEAYSSFAHFQTCQSSHEEELYSYHRPGLCYFGL